MTLLIYKNFRKENNKKMVNKFECHYFVYIFLIVNNFLFFVFCFVKSVKTIWIYEKFIMFWSFLGENIIFLLCFLSHTCGYFGCAIRFKSNSIASIEIKLNSIDSIDSIHSWKDDLINVIFSFLCIYCALGWRKSWPQASTDCPWSLKMTSRRDLCRASFSSPSRISRAQL